jgi:hypothetical protein
MTQRFTNTQACGSSRLHEIVNALGEKVKGERDEAEAMGTISQALLLLGISRCVNLQTYSSPGADATFV